MLQLWYYQWLSKETELHKTSALITFTLWIATRTVYRKRPYFQRTQQNRYFNILYTDVCESRLLQSRVRKTCTCDTRQLHAGLCRMQCSSSSSRSSVPCTPVHNAFIDPSSNNRHTRGTVGWRQRHGSGDHARIDSDRLLIYFFSFRNSQLSTLYSSVKSRTEMTIITTVRYQGNALTDTFNANMVKCLTLLVHTSTHS